MARKPVPQLATAISTPQAVELTATADDAALLAACQSDATLLPRLHREAHTAFLAARGAYPEGWSALDAAWQAYSRSASGVSRLDSLEPPNSVRVHSAMIGAMRLALTARAYFLDYRGEEMSAADRLVRKPVPTSVQAHRLSGLGGETRWERDQRLEMEADHSPRSAAA